MKNNFQILTDSVSDLPASWVRAHPYVTIVDTPIMVSDSTGYHDFRHISADDFMKIDKMVKAGGRASTSMPQVGDPFGDNPDSVETFTRNLLEQGIDVVYIAMGSAMSGTFNSVTLCYKEINEEYKGRAQAYCLDSRCMSTGLALLILNLCDSIENGEVSTVGEIADFVTKSRSYIGHFFTWGELSYIRLSGRVDAMRAFAANILGIRLVGAAVYKDDDETRTLEHVNPHGFIRGIKRWANVIGEYATKHIVDPCGRIIVAHGNVPRDAEIVVSQLREYFPKAQILTGPEWRCGAGIQCHGGPTSIHVNFETNDICRYGPIVAELKQIIASQRK